ncbi:hypothetical protein E6C76_03525 [Pseudothauera nasutitermitis]|uniref:Uncharacterized protein n=1 Tax=Pseudothauera nasutitermitis TaxID=2565930 RepID=A0A4S4B6I8_9RHOO|nr:hypothetical protein [Pseudothauera nasutitermitis]THF67446.1 hypothetical protein E6C76_03525 [Pseudothauera nasutitermitis]
MTQDAASPIPADPLAALASSEEQRRAARMAQDAFAQVFRLTLEADDAQRESGVGELRAALGNWAAAGQGEDGTALRLAMLLNGLDQWGVAYSRAYGLNALPGLSELVGALRTALDECAEARFLTQFEALGAAEHHAIDFKVDLRRAIHLALWHGAIAAGEREEALRLAGELGGVLLAVAREMPELGWRLVADALAHIQIQCLAHGLAAEGTAREATEALFAALMRELPAGTRDATMAHAAQAVVGWRQANRPH